VRSSDTVTSPDGAGATHLVTKWRTLSDSQRSPSTRCFWASVSWIRPCTRSCATLWGPMMVSRISTRVDFPPPAVPRITRNRWAGLGLLLVAGGDLCRTDRVEIHKEPPAGQDVLVRGCAIGFRFCETVMTPCEERGVVFVHHSSAVALVRSGNLTPKGACGQRRGRILS
jgi:hypothetical protein